MLVKAKGAIVQMVNGQHPSFGLLLVLFLFFYAVDTAEQALIAFHKVSGLIDGGFAHTTMVALAAIVLLVFQTNFTPATASTPAKAVRPGTGTAADKEIA
jgi:hypothetical protein